MNERDDLTQRLSALGAHPVDPAVASQHLGQMALATPARASRWSHLRVAAALGAGFLIGGTGLAGATGTLDDIARPVVSAVTGDDDTVEVDVEDTTTTTVADTTSTTVDDTTSTTVDDTTSTTVEGEADAAGDPGCSGFGHAHGKDETGAKPAEKPLKSDYCDNGNPDPHKVGGTTDTSVPEADDDDEDGDDGPGQGNGNGNGRGSGGGNGHQGGKHEGKHPGKDG